MTQVTSTMHCDGKHDANDAIQCIMTEYMTQAKDSLDGEWESGWNETNIKMAAFFIRSLLPRDDTG
jgi:hypothetical protein